MLASRLGWDMRRLGIRGGFEKACSKGLSFWKRNTAEVRGGSWNNNQGNAPVSNRNRTEPTNHNKNIRFRCGGYAERGKAAGQSRILHGECGRANSASGPLVPAGGLHSLAPNSKRGRAFW